jgi:hypothetical protein
MHTTVRLKPTSKPADIVIAALLPLQGINSEKARLSAKEQQPHVWDVLRRSAAWGRSIGKSAIQP